VPRWNRSDVLHWKPGPDFAGTVDRLTREYAATLALPDDPQAWPERLRGWHAANLERAADKLQSRLGWFTRAHPTVLRDGRYLLGLYSDGFSFAAAAASDDEGATWTFTGPIVGAGAVQPSFGERDDGTVVAYLRDNGPAPKLAQLAESSDRGTTWSVARDHLDLPEPGAGVDLLVLRSGRWLLFHNDDPSGRHRLAVSISTDQGRTFPRRRWIESAAAGEARFHYPSAIQTRDGLIRVTYSVFRPDALRSADGTALEGKAIGYSELDESWLDEPAETVSTEAGER
jgi:hypothetical protein